MKKFFFVFGICLWILSCSTISGKKDSFERNRSGNIDFEAVIQNAKRKVFPALVFVKPIREEFSTGEKRQQEVFGSGVIISEDGYVVTNNHVVENSIQINCVLFDKEQYPATIAGLDPETDLALLKLDPKPSFQSSPKTQTEDQSTTPVVRFPRAEFGDSDQIEEGQFVMALGSPFGFTRSISLGIISNVHRYIGFKTQYKYNTWIQTDAAINPGNSGGPLVNTEGKIIGINTLGLVVIAEGMAFSIPSSVVIKIVDKLKQDGRVIRAWTGIDLQALKDFQANTFNPAEKGVLIQSVDPGSPAAEAGIKSGDILTHINNQPVVGGTYVEELPAIRCMLADLAIGEKARLTILRDQKQKEFSLTPGLKDKFEGADFDCKRWNFTVKEISKFSTPDLYFLRQKGVYIQGIRYPGNALSAGLQRKDILLSIDDKPIQTLKDVKDIYESVIKDETREKKAVIKLLRQNYPRIFVLDYRFDYSEEE
jgi:serine protease Do